MNFSANVTALPGTTVTEVDFQDAPASSGRWQTFDSETAPTSGNEYDALQFDTTTLNNGVNGANGNDGPVDLRVVAIDSAGHRTATAAQDRVIANNSTFVALSPNGDPVNGTLTLTATSEAGGFQPNTVTFLICPTSADCVASGSWRKLAVANPTLDANGNPSNVFTTTLDTTTLADGSYDLSLTADDGGDPFQGDYRTGMVVDNTAPSVSLQDPGGSLTGVVNLSASATDGTGSGVDAVKFEVSPAAADTWRTIGVANRAPYSAAFDTRQLADGSYDLRVEATDDAGNTGVSASRTAVAVSNPGAQQFDKLSVTNYVVPAGNVSLLGEIAGSAAHETWALGQTSAPPPPSLQGQYTDQGGKQLVLLRYTDAVGWQIADVLRNPDGTAYPLIQGGRAQVFGQMTDAGEAWIGLVDAGKVNGRQQSKVAMFHRLPGGSFLLDPSASSTLKPLIPAGQPQIRLGHSADGTTYGVLIPTLPPSQSVMEPSPTGPVRVTVNAEYGTLQDGSWSIATAPLPSGYLAPGPGTSVTLKALDPNGPGTGWAALAQTQGGSGSPMLASFDASGWHYVSSFGLDALDYSGEFAPGSAQSALAPSPLLPVTPTAVHADPGGVWLAATVGANGSVVARYDSAAGRIVNSWCSSLPRTSFGCGQPLDVSHPSAVPDAVFTTTDGTVADALSPTAASVDVYAHGSWTSVPTPGFGGGAPGRSVFVDPGDGWLVGANTLARISTAPPPNTLAPWPQANRNPLLAAALPPGPATTDTAGALTVGLNGTALHYDPSVGWQVDPTPLRTHHLQLTGVAFDGPSSAFAVGQDGTILRWDGSTWTEDPQSVTLTTNTLNAVAFGQDGQGWAVGGFGTILHYDGTAWSSEQVDPADAGRNVTSVAAAGSDVFAIAGGNLLERTAGGTWQPVDPKLLPSPAPQGGSLKLVSGLPDGGLLVAGKSLLMVRQPGAVALQYAPQSFQGIPVALTAFNGPGGAPRAFISVAPEINAATGPTGDVGGFPAGDGDLLLQTDGGFDDLSRTQYPTAVAAAGGDGVVQPDPVLAVAGSPDGSHAWAVGGYAGTHAADGIGTDQILSARPSAWLTSAIWRYDASGSVQSQATSPAPVTLPATPGTVSFAYFSTPMCKESCAAVQNAQPDVNLTSAEQQMAAFAQQPGGPAFAMLGGNARGPMFIGNWQKGTGALELARMPELLKPLGGLPLYAAYGPRDAVPTSKDQAAPWAQAFRRAPAPFGPGAAPSGIVPQGSGDATGQVKKYYAFDVTQNGGTLRVIVLDNSAGSLESSAAGQSAWLGSQLAKAQGAGLPIVVIAARPLDTVGTQGAASDGDAVAAQLAAAGVLGVFTTGGGSGENFTTQSDRVAEIPANAAVGASQIPEYEGATLGYQQPQNNGVLWYDVSVDTVAQTLTVKAIPVVSSLAIDPVGGLTATRSSTLQFTAIGRRPAATIATTPDDSSFPGYPQYVGIPASSCSGCIGPSYRFTSSDPIVGDFVAPSAPGSPYPKLNADGKTTRSATSGLFCAFNTGTTTVSVTSGLLTSSVPVTVKAGGFGPPCGTVPGGVSNNVVSIPGKTVRLVAPSSGAATPPPPAAAATPLAVFPKFTLPPAPAPVPVPAPPPPAPAPAPKLAPPPPPFVPFTPTPIFSPLIATPPVAIPPIPPAVTPVPPGGATASAQSTVRREEKARKEASQSAYVTRPAGVPGNDWFYPAVGVAGVLAMLLVAGGVRAGPRGRPVLAELREEPPPQPRRRGRWQ